MHKVYASLPDAARGDLGSCLLDALDDPIGHSMPYGHDDGITRTVARGLVTAMIMIGNIEKTITVIHITYAG